MQDSFSFLVVPAIKRRSPSRIGKNKYYFCSLLRRKLHKCRSLWKPYPDHNQSQICRCL